MKNEKDTIRALFEDITLSDEEITRMEQQILHPAEKTRKYRRKLRLGPLAAAILVMVLSLTAISAAPAIRKYFFPGVGVVEVTGEEEAAPLYMMLDTAEHPVGNYELLAGYWHNGTAKAWIRSQTRYEELPEEDLFSHTDAVLTLESFANAPVSSDEYIQTYSITYPSVSWEDAAEGLFFDSVLLRFSRVPAEYLPYTMEQSGLQLTLIPLTEDFTTFAAEIAYLDGRDKIELLTKTHYINQNDKPAMYLADEQGNLYPLKKYHDSEIFTIDETPSAPIVGFRADYLVISRDFSDDDMATVLSVPLPAEGESAVLDMDFTFPDGVTKGRIHAVGYNNFIMEEHVIDREMEFPLGYLSVITEALEQDGIRYWFEVTYTEEYYKFLEEFTVMEVKSPYDLSQSPLAPKTRLSMMGLTNMIHRTEHYVSDGSDTVELMAYWYHGIAPGDWNIDFTTAE